MVEALPPSIFLIRRVTVGTHDAWHPAGLFHRMVVAVTGI